MNLMKLVCAIFTLYQNAFCYFFQASEECKADNDNDLKYLVPPRHISQLKTAMEKCNCELRFCVTLF